MTDAPPKPRVDMRRLNTGRPALLNDELAQRIVLFIKAGNYAETAAAYAGISKEHLHDWLRWGRRYLQGRGPNGSGPPKRAHKKYAVFVQAVEQAQAEAEVRGLSYIEDAAKDGAWQAAAWRLERQHPDRYGRREKLDLDATVREERDPLQRAVLDNPALAEELGDVLARVGSHLRARPKGVVEQEETT